jgi:hypothetical protein
MRKTTHVSGKKDDRTDAKIHATYFRLHPDLFRSVGEVSETVASLKLLCNWREQLIHGRIAWVNQIRAHLKDVFPGLHQLRLKLSNQWVLRLLVETPTAHHFSQNIAQDWIDKLASHTKREPDEIEALLCGVGCAPSSYVDLVGEKIKYLAEKTLDHVMQIKACEREMKSLCDTLDDELARELDPDSCDPTAIKVLRSFPMMGVVTLARIIAEYPETRPMQNRFARIRAAPL